MHKEYKIFVKVEEESKKKKKKTGNKLDRRFQCQDP